MDTTRTSIQLENQFCETYWNNLDELDTYTNDIVDFVKIIYNLIDEYINGQKTFKTWICNLLQSTETSLKTFTEKSCFNYLNDKIKNLCYIMKEESRCLHDNINSFTEYKNCLVE